MAFNGFDLCGGKSTRMGRPKEFLPYQGTSMISHMIDTMRGLFTEVLLVTNEPELFDGFEIDIVKDILPHRGPVGGILSGLLIANNHHSFVVACDMPFINRQIIECMVKQHEGSDVLVLKHDQVLSLCWEYIPRNVSRLWRNHFLPRLICTILFLV